MRGSTFKRCGCPEGRSCPRLRERRHGTWGYDRRLATSTGTRTLRRTGFDTRAAAQKALGHVDDLVRLADDDATRERVGDMIFERSRRGGQLPAVEDVRRRLGAGGDPAGPGVTFGAAWDAWLAGKKRLRPSARARLEQIGRHWLLPVLAGVPLERLNGAHCAAVFERIERINDAITAAQAAGSRGYVRVEDDVRERPKLAGTASQHRVYGALREFANFEVRKTHRLAFNPVYAVELAPEEREEARRWSAGQAARFLASCESDPLGLLFRVVVLRGARRAEACGFRWSGADLDAGYLSVDRPILLVGRDMIEGQPKSAAGRRKVWLDAATIALLREHRKAQLAVRLRMGESWADHDLIFSDDLGGPWRPDFVSRRFRQLAAAAGVPVIKLHEGRHSAASLARDAEVDPEIRRKTLGHADLAMTSHYTHIESAAHRAAAESVAALVDAAREA